MAKDKVNYNSVMQAAFKKYAVNISMLSDKEGRKTEVQKMGEGFVKGEWNPNQLMQWSRENTPKSTLNAVSVKKWLEDAGFTNTTISPASTKRHTTPESTSVAPTSFVKALTSGGADNPAMVLLDEYLRVLLPEAVRVVINTVEQILTPQQKLDAQKAAKEMMLNDYLEIVRINAQANIGNMFSEITTPVEVGKSKAKGDEGKSGDLVPNTTPEVADGTESESHFLDRMKQVICNNQALENADYQRLLDLKAKGNKNATELVEIFETSPETEEATS